MEEGTPLTGSLRSPPLPHEVGARNPSWRRIAFRGLPSSPPRSGERWFAKQTGEGFARLQCRPGGVFLRRAHAGVDESHAFHPILDRRIDDILSRLAIFF